MALMTTQPPLPFAPVAHSRPIGQAVEMTENEDGGQVFIYGILNYVWDAGDDAMRRMVAVKLWEMNAAPVADIAAAFGIIEDTLWRWHRALDSGGFTALASGTRGPKGGSKLTTEVIARIHELKKTGLANTRIGKQVGVSEFSVRRALTLVLATEANPEPRGLDMATRWDESEPRISGKSVGWKAFNPAQSSIELMYTNCR